MPAPRPRLPPVTTTTRGCLCHGSSLLRILLPSVATSSTNRMLLGRDAGGRSSHAERMSALIRSRSAPGAAITSTATMAPVSGLGRPHTRATSTEPMPTYPLLDGQWMHLDASDIDDLGGTSAEHDPVTDDLHQVAGGTPAVRVDRTLSVVAEHPGAGPDPELTVDDPHVDIRLIAAFEDLCGEPRSSVAHGAAGAELGGGVDLRDARVRKRRAELIEDRGGHGLASETHLAEAGDRPGIRSELREQEPPVRRGCARMRHAEPTHRLESLAGAPGSGRDKSGARRHDVQQTSAVRRTGGSRRRATSAGLRRGGPGPRCGPGESSRAARLEAHRSCRWSGPGADGWLPRGRCSAGPRTRPTWVPAGVQGRPGRPGPSPECRGRIARRGSRSRPSRPAGRGMPLRRRATLRPAAPALASPRSRPPRTWRCSAGGARPTPGVPAR